MVELELSRQSEIVSPMVGDTTVSIVGCGGIGSNVAEVLARIGVQRFTLYDDDIVQPPNIAPGAFRPDQIRRPKTEAVAEILVDLGVPRENILTFGRFERDDEHGEHDIVIVGTDDMESRRDVWAAMNSSVTNPLYNVYIDARMGGDGYELYSVDSQNLSSRREYEMHSLDSVETQDLPCGMKSTAYLTRMIAGLVGERVRSYVNGDWSEVPEVVYYDATEGMATS